MKKWQIAYLHKKMSAKENFIANLDVKTINHFKDNLEINPFIFRHADQELRAIEKRIGQALEVDNSYYDGYFGDIDKTGIEKKARRLRENASELLQNMEAGQLIDYLAEYLLTAQKEEIETIKQDLEDGELSEEHLKPQIDKKYLDSDNGVTLNEEVNGAEAQAVIPDGVDNAVIIIGESHGRNYIPENVPIRIKRNKDGAFDFSRGEWRPNGGIKVFEGDIISLKDTQRDLARWEHEIDRLSSRISDVDSFTIRSKEEQKKAIEVELLKVNFAEEKIAVFIEKFEDGTLTPYLQNWVERRCPIQKTCPRQFLINLFIYLDIPIKDSSYILKNKMTRCYDYTKWTKKNGDFRDIYRLFAAIDWQVMKNLKEQLRLDLSSFDESEMDHVFSLAMIANNPRAVRICELLQNEGNLGWSFEGEAQHNPMRQLDLERDRSMILTIADQFSDTSFGTADVLQRWRELREIQENNFSYAPEFQRMYMKKNWLNLSGRPLALPEKNRENYQIAKDKDGNEILHMVQVTQKVTSIEGKKIEGEFIAEIPQSKPIDFLIIESDEYVKSPIRGGDIFYNNVFGPNIVEKSGGIKLPPIITNNFDTLGELYAKIDAVKNQNIYKNGERLLYIRFSAHGSEHNGWGIDLSNDKSETVSFADFQPHISGEGVSGSQNSCYAGGHIEKEIKYKSVDAPISFGTMSDKLATTVDFEERDQFIMQDAFLMEEREFRFTADQTKAWNARNPDHVVREGMCYTKEVQKADLNGDGVVAIPELRVWYDMNVKYNDPVSYGRIWNPKKKKWKGVRLARSEKANKGEKPS